MRVIRTRSSHRPRTAVSRAGFTLAELMVVVVLLGIMAALVAPNIDMSRARADTAAMQVRSIFQQAHRTAVSQQHQVIVSVDTAGRRIRFVEDRNNDRTIQATDRVRWIPIEDGTRFGVPPVGVNGAATAAVVGGTATPIDGLPSLIFRRDGSVNAEGQIYLQSDGRRVYHRAIVLNKAIGRASWFRLRYGTTTWDEAGY